MIDIDTLLHGFGTKAPSRELKIHDMSSGSYLASCEANFCNEIILAREKNIKERIKNKIKAIEMMEQEEDPKIKRRMQIYIENGNYDFRDIRDF